MVNFPFKSKVDINSIVAVTLKFPAFQKVLSDIKDAIRSPPDTGFHCHRAVECIRKILSKSETKEGKQWENMREILHLTKEYIKPLTDKSKDDRHAEFYHFDDKTRKDLFQRTYTIVDRFIYYTQAGKLDKKEFPVL